MYFTNISLVGSFAYEDGGKGAADSAEAAGGKQPDPAPRPMSYQEKVSQLKAELRSLLSHRMRDRKINNSVYRLGTDQNLQKTTYGHIRDSLHKIKSNDKLAKQTPLPPNLYFNSQLGGLPMPAGLGLLPAPGAGLSPLMPGAQMPFAMPPSQYGDNQASSGQAPHTGGMNYHQTKPQHQPQGQPPYSGADAAPYGMQQQHNANNNHNGNHYGGYNNNQGGNYQYGYQRGRHHQRSDDGYATSYYNQQQNKYQNQSSGGRYNNYNNNYNQ